MILKRLFTFLKKINIKLSSYFYLALPLLFGLADFFIRRDYLLSQNAKEIALFPISVIYEIFFYFVLFFLFSLLKKLQTTAVVIFSAGLSFILVLVYGHFFYFGILPNNVSITFALNHYHDAYALTLASVHWYHATVFVILFLIIFSLTQKSIQAVAASSKKNITLAIVIFAGMTLLFSNNVRFHPDSYSFTPNTIFAVKYVVQERLLGSQFEIRRGYVKRQFSMKTREKNQPAYNCLLILGESVRGANMHYNGYERQTSPFVDSLVAAQQIIPFRKYFSNCVSTQYAVPMILSGNFTIEKLHQPYIYDYIKSWTTAKTFFISSQSMVVSNIHLVYETLLDTFICQERTNLKQFNDMGASDQEMLPVVKTFLQTKQHEKFFGVIQFNNTHYPYTISDTKYEHFTPAEKLSMNSYDNALLEQDDIIRKYFSLLAEQKLLDSTIVIFTADHGEAFNEHGHSGHLQTLYQEDISVPMWIYLPPGFSNAYRNSVHANSRNNASHLDIFPTILDLFGLNDTTLLNLHPAGTSLLKKREEHTGIPFVGLDMIDTKGILVDSLKYIVTFRQNKKNEELYDIKNDPQETKNLWKTLTEDQRKFFLQKFSESEKKRLSYKVQLQ